eukprot:12423875-Prorocentrum_lima.AAC.1
MTSSLVGSEMCIRDSMYFSIGRGVRLLMCRVGAWLLLSCRLSGCLGWSCLLYTSDAADDM